MTQDIPASQHQTAPLCVGDRLTPLIFGPISRAFLARYAAASSDFNPIHIDSDYAKAGGHRDIFAHGMASLGLLSRMILQNFPDGRVTSLSGRFTAITKVGAIITLSGTIRAIVPRDQHLLVRLDIQSSVPKHQVTIIGQAEILLPLPIRSA